MPLIKQARRVRFSVKAVRDNLITHLTDMANHYVTPDERFPNYALVRIDGSLVGGYIDTIIIALDLGERDGDSRTNENDQKVQVFKTAALVESHLTTVGTADAAAAGVFTRDSFEKYYDVAWGTPSSRSAST